ncbi:MAG: hypothetical protein V2A54_09655 [Bacteroidota bacterium]
MQLDEFIESLPSEKQIEVALRFARIALVSWDTMKSEKEVSYHDSIVFLRHNFKNNFLQLVLDAVEKNNKDEIINLYTDFAEPITALQDDDFTLSYSVEKTFYGFYNLLKSLIDKEDRTFDQVPVVVSVNQFIDAIDQDKIIPDDEIRKILNEYKKFSKV